MKEEGKRNSDLSERFYQFALRVVKLVRSLQKETASYEIGRQLIRAGTSVCANYEEAQGAFSKKDFIFKLSISLKEARESSIWLRLLRDSGLKKDEEIEDLIRESKEIGKILGKSIVTSKKGS